MTLHGDDLPKVMRLFLEISQYPILAQRIRERMRAELIARGVIAPDVFEAEVREKAIQSQHREGLADPFAEEAAETWERRMAQIRDSLTDFYFAFNLPHENFVAIVQSLLDERAPGQEVVLSFNPELAPWDWLFAQAEAYESLPPETRAQVQHHLREIIVVLIKGMISDHLSFVGVAKEWFTIRDLREIRARRIGSGKIGGKAAGMLLAWKMLQCAADERLRERVVIPESYFIGADVFYDYQSLNGLQFTLNQKYRTPEEIECDYPEIQRRFVGGRFPEAVAERLRNVLDSVSRRPLIVRSSSLLEDSFGTSFAGKYESVFCPNQGTPGENLRALTLAISRIYASVYNPDALAYRRRQGLIDYDERMAVLLQVVQGEAFGRYFLPAVAGVAFSRNPFRWSPRIRWEDGFLRMVWGLGTRAVERLGNDYPRMVALGQPQLRPEVGAREIRRYSQRFVDTIDLGANSFVSLPVSEMPLADFPGVEALASVERDGDLQPLVGLPVHTSPTDLVLTFDSLLRGSEFAPLMKNLLQQLERGYRGPVDIEFTLSLGGERRRRPVVHLLQCRPQSQFQSEAAVAWPAAVPAADQLFTARRLVPHGVVSGVRYVVYVDPKKYGRLRSPSAQHEIARLIGRLNKRLEGEVFVLLGPPRWGSSNPSLGVKVTYADIHNTRALIEVALPGAEATPEASYGTHFFQDLVESQIYPLVVYPDDPGTVFRAAFFEKSPNGLEELLPGDAGQAEVVRVLDVSAVANGRLLEIVMDAGRGEAMAYLKAPHAV